MKQAPVAAHRLTAGAQQWSPGLTDTTRAACARLDARPDGMPTACTLSAAHKTLGSVASKGVAHGCAADTCAWLSLADEPSG
jgi:hypothetical protein